MASKHRRDFLKLCAASVPALIFANGVDADETTVPPAAYRTPTTIERYIDRLPIPQRLAPHTAHKDKDEYRVRMVEFTQQMHSQLPPTKLWGYEGHYPGPTFEALQNRTVEVQWENHLPAQHIFAIDPHLHGAMPPAPAVRTVPHLHGSRTRSISDGLPEKWFTPGTSALYTYPNEPARRDALVSRPRSRHHAPERVCGLVGLLSPARRPGAQPAICLPAIMRFPCCCRIEPWMTRVSWSILRPTTMA